jgi:hypothetical protein
MGGCASEFQLSVRMRHVAPHLARRLVLAQSLIAARTAFRAGSPGRRDRPARRARNPLVRYRDKPAPTPVRGSSSADLGSRLLAIDSLHHQGSERKVVPVGEVPQARGQGRVVGGGAAVVDHLEGTALEGALQYPPPSVGEGAQPPRRPEWCRSPYHRVRANWAPAGQACRRGTSPYSSIRQSRRTATEDRPRLQGMDISGCAEPSLGARIGAATIARSGLRHSVMRQHRSRSTTG